MSESKTEPKIRLKTIEVENKQIVMPRDTVTLNIDDVMYYEKNKNKFDGNKKSPYLIYLSTEFKNTIKTRNKVKLFKVVCGGVGAVFVCFFVATGFQKLSDLFK